MTTDPPTEASRKRQRARAESIAATITPIIIVARPACPVFADLVVAIHVALDATEPNPDTDPAGALLKVADILGVEVDSLATEPTTEGGAL